MNGHESSDLIYEAQTHLAELELSSFVSAVTKLYGPEHASLFGPRLARRVRVNLRPALIYGEKLARCHDRSSRSIGRSIEHHRESVGRFRPSTDIKISINTIVQLSGLHASGLIETGLWQPSKSSTLTTRP